MKGTQNLFMTEKKVGLMSEDNEKEIFKKFEFIPKDVFIMNIATTIANTFLLTTSGKLYSWGKNCNELGRHCVQDIDAFKPQLLDIQSKIVEIAAGSHHVMALDENGQIFSWGLNNFGQLGDNNEEFQSTAHLIKFFVSEPVVQIYAGGDSSYAITRKGDLYVWGDNRNQQLGVLGTFHNEPKQLVNTPWEVSTREDRIVLSKDNVGYIFQPFIVKEYSRTDEYLSNDYKLQIDELNTKIKQLEGQAKETKGANDHEGKGGDKINNDPLIKNITQQLKAVNNEISNHEIIVYGLQEQIEIMIQELDNIKKELNEISRKENQLIGQRDGVDNKIRKIMRSGNDPSAIEDLQKENKRFKELLQANDNIKNTLIKRQDETDGQMKIYEEQLGKNKKIQEQHQQRQQLLIAMDNERKNTIKTAILGGKQVDLQRFVNKIYYFYKMMYETSISEIAKKESKAVGLEVMLEESNSKLNYIKNELSQFKVNSNDGIYELVQRISEMAMDNLNIRMRLNDYIKALIMEVSQKNEDYLQSFQEQNKIDETAFHSKDNKDRTISLFILKQKQKMMEIAKNSIDIKSYIQEIQKVNKGSDKKRGCFG